MVKKIVWTNRANSKFIKIVHYLEGEWGDKVAENFVRKTFDIIDLISDHPEIGTIEHAEKNIRGVLLTKHNRIFYRATNEEIILLNFFDSRSGPKRKRA